MSAKKGALVLIKIGDGGEPEQFTTIGGLRVTRMLLNHQLLETTNRHSGSWRQLMDNAGITSLDVTGSGLFVDSEAEESVRLKAFSSQIANYRFYFANGDYVTGAFLIAAYERAGNHDDVELYSLTLHSAGNIAYTTA